jgi:hypothetical protein
LVVHGVLLPSCTWILGRPVLSRIDSGYGLLLFGPRLYREKTSGMGRGAIMI